MTVGLQAGFFLCAQCHIPDLTINHDRRVADVETVYDQVKGIFNSLFATATTLYQDINCPTSAEMGQFETGS